MNQPTPTTRTRTSPPRSGAWFYYALLACLGLVLAPSTQGKTVIASVLCGLYAVYLYRGGRIVIWFW